RLDNEPSRARPRRLVLSEPDRELLGAVVQPALTEDLQALLERERFADLPDSLVGLAEQDLVPGDPLFPCIHRPHLFSGPSASWPGGSKRARTIRSHPTSIRAVVSFLAEVRQAGQ